MQETKKNGTQTYSIVSAVYNVAPYLHKYFQTLTNQSLGFNQNIQLILIDDGSTDSSAKIIKEWQAKYPNNITYLYKQNGGQASARNLGLAHVKTTWVTFIDPDDFINKHYFKEVNHCINNNNNKLALVSCSIQYYFEKYKLYVNRHPLRRCFQNIEEPYIIKDMEHNVQLSASTAFFRIDLIQNMGLQFNEAIKPNFEDAHFVNSYFIRYNHLAVYFLKSAIYYYRRRSSKNSTIDTAWSKKALFNNVLQFGCLDLFRQSMDKDKFVPIYLQRTVLYHLAWYYRNLMNHNEKIDFLSHKEHVIFHNLMQKIFTYIDLETINNFNFANIDFFEKLAWTNLYKNTSLPYQILFVEKQKNILKLRYFSHKAEIVKITINKQAIPINFTLKKEHSFVKKAFINEYLATLPIQSHNHIMDVQIGNTLSYIETDTTKVLQKIKISEIKTNSKKKIKILFHNISRKLLLG